jgi:hypothetical protein
MIGGGLLRVFSETRRWDPGLAPQTVAVPSQVAVPFKVPVGFMCMSLSKCPSHLKCLSLPQCCQLRRVFDKRYALASSLLAVGEFVMI